MRERFTRWYYKQGYTFGVENDLKPRFKCPWYIRPLLFLFSPSVYFRCLGEYASYWIKKGIEKGYHE